MIEQQYPYAYQFFSGYFHQDWSLEFEGPDDVIVDFVDGEAEEQVILVCSDIDKILKSGEIANNSLSAEALGCFYEHDADDLTLTDWLRHVKKLLTKA